jgi:hypothetical protein
MYRPPISPNSMLFYLITFCAPLSKIRSAAQVRSGVGGGGEVTNMKKEMSIRTNIFSVFVLEGMENGQVMRKGRQKRREMLSKGRKDPSGRPRKIKKSSS